VPHRKIIITGPQNTTARITKVHSSKGSKKVVGGRQRKWEGKRCREKGDSGQSRHGAGKR